MILSEGLATLDLTMTSSGTIPRVIHPALLWDDENVILVDTGVPGQLQAIREAMDKLGVPFQQLNKVIITHQDLDHIGSLPEVVAAADPALEVIAHELAKPYIEGDKPLVKMTPERLAKMLETLPEERRQDPQAVSTLLPKAKVDTTVVDGQHLPYCGGITVIFTPGHTPDHISLYLHRSKTLVAGDALTVDNGQLSGPRAEVTHDMATATASIEKFTHFDVAAVICYHGGAFQEDANKRLAALATSQGVG
jgi:glyoxylase-like metal-dependent hydrolase (beta-lactamase superfamily II)